MGKEVKLNPLGDMFVLDTFVDAKWQPEIDEELPPDEAPAPKTAGARCWRLHG